MKLLLDTHAFIWSIFRSRMLSARVAELIQNPGNRVLVSAASAYEIEFKRARDPFLAALPADLGEAVDLQGFEWLAVSPAHAIAAGRLPRLSGDPFDRILAAQALTENATILTRDPLVAAYGPVALW
jgi:PIN domain nuclease of toxin-antitoxin system